MIAAKLNIANGSNPVPIATALAAADIELAGVVVPAEIKANTTLGHAMTQTAAILDNYNNGALTPNCTTKLPGTGPAQP